MPELTKMEVFGAKTGKKACMEFPTPEDFHQLQFNETTKLKSIHWRNNDVLKGL